jgi:uncharacterized protein YdiU (UPF0061 family)
VREVIAAEALQQLGVKTSRCLSLVETGESLWRGDEPSPTRSSVMIRVNRSHIRFGTFERLHYLQRSDLIQKLLDHVIDIYYPQLHPSENRYAEFYRELVQRVAELAAQWMVAGFCHGVLNTDNMSITGESFDYGPYAFIPEFDLRFTAAYFDYSGLYSYGNQPYICQLNLERLQVPLSMVMPKADLEVGLAAFTHHYHHAYAQGLARRLGFTTAFSPLEVELLQLTVDNFQETQLDYQGFFSAITEQFNEGWRKDPQTILENSPLPAANWEQWRKLYHQILVDRPAEAMTEIGDRLLPVDEAGLPRLAAHVHLRVGGEHVADGLGLGQPHHRRAARDDPHREAVAVAGALLLQELHRVEHPLHEGVGLEARRGSLMRGGREGAREVRREEK